MRRSLLSIILLSLIGVGLAWSGPRRPKVHDDTDIQKLLTAVRSRDVQFASVRDPPSKPPSLERRIVLTAPPQLVTLAASGDLRVLDGLVELLKQPDQAWAAQVVLSAMTRRDEKIVEGFSTSPDEWLKTVGQNAYARWKGWLDEHRARLTWDAQRRMFVERAAGPK